ncbi:MULTISPECIES: hypothetical protein [unclassified Sphingomonas]|uniref:hypothetical protein n=1 Tax=unclassified Sphingomonas TaxID=196159 RepID=UPI0012E37AFA|nr:MULTISPECIES: hypothetical protein [unclassified Sphingomonas]
MFFSAALLGAVSATSAEAAVTGYASISSVFNRIKCDAYAAMKSLPKESKWQPIGMSGEVTFSIGRDSSTKLEGGFSVPIVSTEASFADTDTVSETQGVTIAFSVNLLTLSKLDSYCSQAGGKPAIMVRGVKEAEKAAKSAKLNKDSLLGPIDLGDALSGIQGEQALNIKTATYEGSFGFTSEDVFSGTLGVVYVSGGAEKSKTNKFTQGYSIVVVYGDDKVPGPRVKN